MRNVRTLLMITAISTVLCGQAKADDQCIGSMADLANAPEIQRIIAGFGGAENLEGSWKLAGIAGSFVQAKVKFDNRETSFWTQYNDEPANQIDVCTSDDQQSLKLVVREPQDPNNKIIYVKSIDGTTDQMMVSAFASDWKFVKFKKVHSIQDQPQADDQSQQQADPSADQSSQQPQSQQP